MADYTWESVLSMYSLMTLFVLGTGFFLVRGLRSGALTGGEEPKYRIFDDDLPAVAGDVRRDS